MSDIQRYAASHAAYECDTGEYIHFKDHHREIAKKDATIAELKHVSQVSLNNVMDSFYQRLDGKNAEIAELKRSLHGEFVRGLHFQSSRPDSPAKPSRIADLPAPSETVERKKDNL